MRISKSEISIIKDVVREVFGIKANVYLFGSRTDDTKHGGDIDLLVQCNQELSSSERYELKIKFLVALKNKMGDQKIDVLVDAGQPVQPIYQTALKTGIRL